MTATLPAALDLAGLSHGARTAISDAMEAERTRLARAASVAADDADYYADPVHRDEIELMLDTTAAQHVAALRAEAVRLRAAWAEIYAIHCALWAGDGLGQRPYARAPADADWAWQQDLRSTRLERAA